MTLEIDHIVVCVADLDGAARAFEAEHGVVSVAGGRHSGQGTANRLIPLGGTYIELLAAVDPDEARTSALGTWALHRATVPGADGLCLRTDDLDALSAGLGVSQMEMSRVTPDGLILSWRLAGLERALASGLPFFIAWDIPDDLHPGRIVVTHPAGPLALGRVTISGDVSALEQWAPGTPNLSYLPGDPGVTFELVSPP